MGYRLEIIYQKGKDNVIADSMSRRTHPENKEGDVEKDFEDLIMSLGDLVEGDVSPKERKKSPVLVEIKYDQSVDRMDKGQKEAVISAIKDSEEAPTVIEVEMENVEALQKECPDLKDIFTYLEEGRLPENDKDVRTIALTAENYTIEDGKLYHLHRPKNKGVRELKGCSKTLVLPRSLRRSVIDAYHKDSFHVGFDRVYDTVRSEYFWPRRMYTGID